MKPLIGISPTPREADLDHGRFRSYTLSDTYSHAVIAAGGIPVILPAHPEMIDDILDTLDAVIFSGGGDIDPSYWSEERHPAADGFDEQRDTFELQAIPKVIARDMPMLGICRGLQTINVAQGGSLYQDIPDQIANALQHRQQKDGKTRDEPSHPITIDAGDNPLRAAVGSDTTMVNSFHHQSVKDIGEGLEVIARSDDGVIEAMWLPAMSFGLAVQWHPEMLAPQFPDQARIFDALVAAAKAKKQIGVAP